MQILENEPMNKHTSFKVGGPARFFVKASVAKKFGVELQREIITLAGEF